MDNYHKPVLLKEVLDGLKIKKDEKYIDATLGGGGHTRKILELGGVVLGIDVDQDAIDFVNKKKLGNLTLVRGNFRDIEKVAPEYNFTKVAGILFDLGVSSHQLDEPTRGFSFQQEGPLDMRMDRELGVRALDLIKVLTKGELNEIFAKYGEETHSWAISDAIVRARNVKPIETTSELAKIAFGIAGQSKKVFQALRIIVNDELNAITEALPKGLELLKNGGRMCVISFHSLEDRIVKKTFLEFEKKEMGKIITKKPIVPTEKEIEENKRAGSAKLRIFEKQI